MSWVCLLEYVASAHDFRARASSWGSQEKLLVNSRANNRRSKLTRFNTVLQNSSMGLEVFCRRQDAAGLTKHVTTKSNKPQNATGSA